MELLIEMLNIQLSCEQAALKCTKTMESPIALEATILVKIKILEEKIGILKQKMTVPKYKQRQEILDKLIE